MIAKDNLPVQTLQKQGFTVLMHTLATLCRIPNKKKITQLIDEKYGLLSDTIEEKLSQLSHLALTTDIWTDPLNTKRFLGITCHCICNDMPQSVTIGVTELNTNHSSEIEKWLEKIMKDWKIEKKSIHSCNRIR